MADPAQPGVPGSPALTLVSALAGSCGRYVLAAIAASALVAGTLGGIALHDWQSSIAITATAQCRLSDLEAAERARDQTQHRLSEVQTEMQRQSERLQAEQQARLAAIDAAAAKVKSVAACPIELPRSRTLK